jgi:hypothetical protein
MGDYQIYVDKKYVVLCLDIIFRLWRMDDGCII